MEHGTYGFGGGIASEYAKRGVKLAFIKINDTLLEEIVNVYRKRLRS